MQKIDIDLIVRKTLIELKKNWNLEKKYNKIKNKPQTSIREFSFKEICKIIFYNNFIQDSKFNKKFMELNTIYIEYKEKWETKKRYLWKFYEWTSEFIKIIKITFIKNFINKVKFCPYCWKNNLTYFWNIDRFYDEEDDNRRTFELDHFFPKDTFYNIWFNLYNLIPSCKSCNHLKHNLNPFEKTRFFHPYFWWIEDNTIITEKNFDDEVTFNEKDLKNREYILNTEHWKLFTLKEIYNYSQDTKNDIWFIRDKVEKIKTDKMNDKNLWLNKFNLEERKDLFFKNFYPKSEQDILKFSNWKLKKDLIGNLKL
jgi:hypothetical protein